MSSSRIQPTQVIAASLDDEPAISAQNLVAKFLLHWPIFAACVVIAPLLALGLATQLPDTFKSSAQILIRHQGSSLSLYSGYSTNLTVFSGATAAELLRNEPIVSKMIEEVGVEDADVARAAYKVLFGKAYALISPLLGRDPVDAGLSGNLKLRNSYLAGDLKSSIDASTLMMDRGSGTSRDEIIEINLKSTNRERVALMINSLCENFIAEYNRVAREEALAAHKTFGEQASALEAEWLNLQTQRDAVAGMDTPPGQLGKPIIENNPLAGDLARSIAETTVRLTQLRQTYVESAPEIQRAKAELAAARQQLSLQEAIESLRARLEIIRQQQRALTLTAELLAAGQGPLSIAERGLTPKKTKLTVILHYGVPGAAGLVAGTAIGLVTIFLLGLLDPRVMLAADVAALSSLPLLGSAPRQGLPMPSFSGDPALPLDGTAQVLRQTLGRLDVLPLTQRRSLLITSADNESGTAEIALQLAALWAREPQGTVLLIDANFDRPTLTTAATATSVTAGTATGNTTSANQAPGLLDALAGQATAAQVVQPTPLARVALVPIGQLSLRDTASSVRERWPELLREWSRDHRAIVVSAGGLLHSREAAALALGSDQVVLVTESTRSQKLDVTRALTLLHDSGAHLLGIIHCARRRHR